MALYAAREPEGIGTPRDGLMLQSGCLLMFPYLSLVVGSDGEIRDAFPTSGLRPVGSSETAILFVQGGGRASSTGYFTPTPVVRDIVHRRWVVGGIPPGLPRYVAGTIGDVKWAIVADLERAVGYRVSPGWPSDQCGGTMTSLDGRHAFDGGPFVVDAATRRPVVDARALDGDVLSFVQREDGAWRFLMLSVGVDEDKEEVEGGETATAPRVVDEAGREVGTFPDALSLSRHGRRILCASADEASILTVDSAELAWRADLRPLAQLFAMPENTANAELWRNLLATFGVAEWIAKQTPETIRSALRDPYLDGENLDDATLRAVIQTARRQPKLSAIGRVPVRLRLDGPVAR
jgi:hypothetical protein